MNDGIIGRMFTFLLGSSWKTSLAGIAPALAIIAWQIWNHYDNDPNTTFSMEAIMAAFGLGFLGRLSRSTGTSDEESGIHPSRTGKHAYMMAVAKKQGVEVSELNMNDIDNIG